MMPCPAAGRLATAGGLTRRSFRLIESHASNTVAQQRRSDPHFVAGYKFRRPTTEYRLPDD